MIETGLQQYLVANVPLVGGRVRPKILPQKTEYPAITYEVVDDERLYDQDGTIGLVDALYQITPWDPSYAQMKEVSQQIRLALQSFTGAMGDVHVAFFRHIGGPELYDDGTIVEGDRFPGVHYHPTRWAVGYSEVFA